MKSLPEFSRQTSRAQAALPRPDTSKAEHTIRRRFIVASPFVAPPRLGRVSVVTEGTFTPTVQCSMEGRRHRWQGRSDAQGAFSRADASHGAGADRSATGRPFSATMVGVRGVARAARRGAGPPEHQGEHSATVAECAGE